MIWLLLLACSEYRVTDGIRTPPVDPPGAEADDFGEPPEWATCTPGWFGRYYNLPEPAEADGELWLPAELAWSRFDPALDFGAGWWPVDEGIAGDPAYFTTRWTGWLRVQGGGGMTVLLGAVDDAWLLVDGEVVAESHGEELVVETWDVDVRSGQLPIELRFAHRRDTEAALRFRVLEGDVQLCPPDFTEE